MLRAFLILTNFKASCIILKILFYNDFLSLKKILNDTHIYTYLKIYRKRLESESCSLVSVEFKDMLSNLTLTNGPVHFTKGATQFT